MISEKADAEKDRAEKLSDQPEEPVSSPPENRLRLSTASLIFIFSLISVTILHLPLAEFPLGRDQGIWATAGLAIKNGAVFFKDFLHFNLPGLGISYALAFCLVDDPRVATMLLSLAGCWLSMTGMYLLLRHTVSAAAAAWAVMLFSVIWPTHVDSWRIAQKDFMAFFGVLLATWFVATAESETKRRRFLLFSGGIFVGISTMYKPIFGIAGPILAIIYAQKSLYRSQKISTDLMLVLLKDLAVLTGGALAIGMLFILYVASGEGLEELYNGLFIFAPMYSEVYRQSFLRLLFKLILRSYILDIKMDFEMLKIPFLIWTPIFLSGFVRMFKQTYVKERVWLSVPFLVALFTHFIQRKGFDYYTIPWQICLLMVAGCWFAWGWSELPQKWTPRKVILSIVLTGAAGLIFGRALFLTPYASAEVPVWLHLVSREKYLQENFKGMNPEKGIPSPLESEKLAKWIRDNSSPEDKILVWGLECHLYAMSGRMFATRTPFDFLLTIDVSHNIRALAWQKTIRHQFINELQSDRPKFIIITRNDSYPGEPVSSNEAIAFVPGFQAIISSQYEKVKSVELFDVFQRKS